MDWQWLQSDVIFMTLALTGAMCLLFGLIGSIQEFFMWLADDNEEEEDEVER